MKLLGWMHRKFGQNSTEPFKDHLVIGQRAVDEEQKYPKWNSFGSKHVRQSENEHKYRRKSFPARVRAENEDEFDQVEEASGGSGMYELVFPGFLAIGTLGSADPSATPTFAISVEIDNLTGKGDEVTENELKLINDELEKVLGKEDDDSSSRRGRRSNSKSMDSSAGRNSHVSSSTGTAGGRRSSSTSNSSTDGSSSNNNGIMSSSLTDHQSNGSADICPLQGYLFGSAIELSETKTRVAKKVEQGHGNRTSLGELFQSEKEKELGHEADKSGISAMHLMKKKLKKGLLHASSRTSAACAGPPVEYSTSAAERKLHKILHMFHRKVHPEISTAAHNDSIKYQKNENKRKTINSVGGHNPPPTEEDKENMQRQYKSKSQSNPLQFPLGSDQDSYENNKEEHWIKTDADYLVLEL